MSPTHLTQLCPVCMGEKFILELRTCPPQISSYFVIFSEYFFHIFLHTDISTYKSFRTSFTSLTLLDSLLTAEVIGIRGIMNFDSKANLIISNKTNFLDKPKNKDYVSCFSCRPQGSLQRRSLEFFQVPEPM